MVGQPAHRQHVRRAVERQAVVEVEPLAGQHLGGDGLKPRVVRAEGVIPKGDGLAGIRDLGLHIPMIQKIAAADHFCPVSTPPAACGSSSTPS